TRGGKKENNRTMDHSWIRMGKGEDADTPARSQTKSQEPVFQSNSGPVFWLDWTDRKHYRVEMTRPFSVFVGKQSVKHRNVMLTLKGAHLITVFFSLSSHLTD